MKHGVLDPAFRGADARFDDDDVEVIRAAYRMVEHGLEPRHLRTIRLGANREVDLFRQLTGPMLRHATPAGRRQAGDVLADIAQAAREMQEAMVRSELRKSPGALSGHALHLLLTLALGTRCTPSPACVPDAARCHRLPMAGLPGGCAPDIAARSWMVYSVDSGGRAAGSKDPDLPWRRHRSPSS